MKKKILPIVTLLVALALFLNVTAQTDSTKSLPTYKVGIFAPLYLDSLFSDNNFRYKQGLPKFVIPAVEFIQGAQIALDSLKPGKKKISPPLFMIPNHTRKILLR